MPSLFLLIYKYAKVLQICTSFLGSCSTVFGAHLIGNLIKMEAFRISLKNAI